MKGGKPHMRPDSNPITVAPPAPEWMAPHARAEWNRVVPALVQRKILTEADLASVEHYCTLAARVREIEAIMQRGEGFDPALFRVQDKAAMSCRLLAAELGLTPVSRSRPSVQETSADDDLLD